MKYLLDPSTPIEKLKLRPYQEKAIEELRSRFRQGKRLVVLSAPTGAGKTLVATRILQGVLESGKRGVFLVDRLALLTQTVDKLHQYGVRCGVMRGGVRSDGEEQIQVCSAQAVERRGFDGLDPDVVIVDECHVQRKGTVKWIREVAKAGKMVIGLSATPITDNLGKVYECVVNVATTDDLIEEGFLSPVDVYIARAQVDLEGVKVRAGEFVPEQLDLRTQKIVGDIVPEWERTTAKVFGGPVKTMVFSQTVSHGEKIVDEFRKRGHTAEQVSYLDGNDDRRAQVIQDFRDGKTQVIVSCAALERGFDVPDVLCGVSARAYHGSLSSHLQQLGRVMRPAPGKDKAIWICHTGNYLGHEAAMRDIYANGVSDLDVGADIGKKKRSKVDKPEERQCPECAVVLLLGARVCPQCGYEIPLKKAKQLDVEVMDGKVEKWRGVGGDDGGGRKAISQWAKGRRNLWKQICALSMEANCWQKDYSVKKERARKLAFASYHEMTGEWPKVGFSDRGAWSSMVEKDVKTVFYGLLADHRRKKNRLRNRTTGAKIAGVKSGA